MPSPHPTDVQSYSPAQVNSASSGGSRPEPATAVGDATQTMVTFYFVSGVLRATVILGVTPGVIVRPTFDVDVSTIAAAGDSPALLHKRLHAAAKIALGVA